MENQKRHSILCPHCRRLISIDEPRPASWWRNNAGSRLFLGTDQLVKTIIYVNLGMYLISLLLNPWSSGFSLSPFSLFSPANKSLLLLGATGTLPIDRLHRWWSLLSANYLHGSVFHILFNMVALRQIAPLVLREYGGYRMFALYTLTGVFGFLVSYLAGVNFTIGASAAICGLIGAALYYGKSRGGIYGQAIFRQIGGWAMGIFLFGFLIPGINNWGHGGGFCAGVVLGFLLGYREKARERVFHRILAGMCALLTVVILGWALISTLNYRILG